MTDKIALYDAVIAGGGPAGAVTAWALAKAGWRVVLVDHALPQRFKVGEGLPPAGCTLLRELGLWTALDLNAHRPAHANVSVWGGDQAQAHDFLFQLHGSGLQLDRKQFDADLRQQAQQTGAELHLQTRLILSQPDAQGPAHVLQLEPTDAGEGTRQTIVTPWLVDATGRVATFARQLGARRRTVDDLMACYLRLESEQNDDEDGNTVVEATSEGWWYSVLLPNRQRLVALLSDKDLMDRRRLLQTDGLWTALQQGTRYLSALCRQHHYRPSLIAPQGADAASTCLDVCAGANWIAVGDAATAFDPLSSKGISNAIYTGHQAAQTLLNAQHASAPQALMSYNEHLQAIFSHYRRHLRHTYQTESRWPDAEFWKRRSA